MLKAPALEAVEHEVGVYNVGFEGTQSIHVLCFSLTWSRRRLVSIPNPVLSSPRPEME